MITASHLSRQPDGGQLDGYQSVGCHDPNDRRPRGASPWQRELACAVRDLRELYRLLELEPQPSELDAALTAKFRLLVPRSFVRRMRRGDRTDPLLRQVLPVAEELLEQSGFEVDPLAEGAAMRIPGLLHKYHGRALLIVTGACAVHCRYCFRREFPYGELASTRSRFQAALAAIARDSSIEEVILSGGDPLSLTTPRLEQLTEALREIPHVRRLRLHTRTAIVLPERIDEEFIAWIGELPWPCVMVLHCNHANEIDDSVRAACARLRSAGAVLLNQAVLLAGVNASVAALEALSEALWSAGVLPYYLHLLDRVRGTAHFEVEEERARSLMADLGARLPGYLVPRLARELPGAPGKLILAPSPWPMS